MQRRPFSILELDHVVLRVTDLEVSLQFYRDVLGCVLERTLPELGLYQLRAGRHLIDLVVVGSRLGGVHPPAVKRPNQDHFCLLIDRFDPEILCAYLDEHRIGYGEVADRYGAMGQGPSLYIRDPDGNTVEIKGN